MEKIKIGEAFNQAWSAYKANWQILIGVLLTTVGFSFLIGYLDNFVDDVFVSALLSLLSMIIGFVLTLGLINVSLNTLDTGRAVYADLFSAHQLIFKYILLMILIGLLSLIGLIVAAGSVFVFFFVPGSAANLAAVAGALLGFVFLVFIYLRVFFAIYVLVDKKVGPVEALKESNRLVKASRSHLVLLGLIVFLVVLNLLGLILLFIGLLVAIPVAALTQAAAYRQLSPKITTGSGTATESPIASEDIATEAVSAEMPAYTASAVSGEGNNIS